MFELLSLFVLILDIYAVIHVLGRAKPFGWQLLWILIILLMPVLGMVIYFVFARN